MNDRIESLICLQIRKRSLDEGMVRNNGGELLVYLCCSGRVARCRQNPGVSIGEAEAVLVIVMRGLQPSLSLRWVSQEARDQARVLIAKSNHRSIVNAVERVERVVQ